MPISYHIIYYFRTVQPVFEPTTSFCTAGEHSSKELFEQLYNCHSEQDSLLLLPPVFGTSTVITLNKCSAEDTILPPLAASGGSIPPLPPQPPRNYVCRTNF
jgi:hypothetical protein